MDISSARTFLEILAAGSFLGAAERLHVTQSTVSARVRTLEEAIGRSLFQRRHDGVALTPAGEQFRRYAAALVSTWEQAKLHLQVPPSYRAVVSVGGQHTVWEALLLEWLGRMRAQEPGIAVRAEFSAPDELTRRLVQGTLDIAVLYSPRMTAGLEVETLLVDHLVLVSTEEDARPPAPERYIYVDWGPQVHEIQAALCPGLSPPGLYVANPGLALSYLLSNGGVAYLPARLVRPHVERGHLHVVEGSPAFEHRAYAVTGAAGATEAVVASLALLRTVAAGSG